ALVGAFRHFSTLSPIHARYRRHARVQDSKTPEIQEFRHDIVGAALAADSQCFSLIWNGARRPCSLPRATQ
ncbi:hypothetical protein, partial [Prescottella equi]|uniref:hypothetical protein n=1 Tax=Rhodococcus hoagii TaxID=43767 RepID=UPI00301D99D0